MSSYQYNSAGSPLDNQRKIRLAISAMMSLAFFYVITNPWNVQPDASIYEKTPMCNKSGKCGEVSTVPSPRTIYSAKTQEQYDLWWQAHAKLNQSAAEYVERRGVSGDNTGNKRSLILIGDSITEEWIGTNMGQPESRWNGVPEVLKEYFEPLFDPLVLAIGGDQTQHLLWRLQNGELLPSVAKDQNAIFIMLIGTNNIGSGFLPGETHLGVMAVAEYILSSTSGKLVMLQILPRGDSHRLQNICPPRCQSNGEPFESFMPAVTQSNNAIFDSVDALNPKYEKRLRLIDCGEEFRSSVPPPNHEVDTNVMPDSLHPNAKGSKILAKCILDGIKDF